ncbi:MAG TPA: AmmeMemoRadiSam system protein A [Candidatus Acidoferrales bacterium]|nr:AmmeMemoRadiSam system protein A [Candidatus Acidoferrales bacterium]
MSPPPSPLSEEERRTLLELARQAILESVCHERMPETPIVLGAVAECRGAFVTLHVNGKLRGCIGHVSPKVGLAETVAQCAILAAQEDYRFDAVRPEEISELEIEISVLTDPVPVKPEEIEIGRHGLLVMMGDRRGLLLPQVASERGWDRQRFLEETCRKADLPPDAWKDPSGQLLAFTAEVFSEAGLRTHRTS